MHSRLKKIYYSLLGPAIAGFIALGVVRSIQQPFVLPAHLVAVIAPAIFILAVVFAVAGPILFRSFFAHRQRNHSRVSKSELFSFERTLIVISLVAPYLALAASYLQLPRFHLVGILLLAFYAVYYHYPSNKRITFDRKIFRVSDSISSDEVL